MYSVPVIPPDLRHEETIIQAANALDYLQKTITDVFDRIDERITRNHVKVRDLQNRIDSASKSINSLVGINKAIKIFSPAKFPATHIFQDIPKTFDSLKHKPQFELQRDYRVTSSQDPISQKSIQEKLVFYHVRDSMQSERTKCGRILNTPATGLGGEIPNNLRSVNGLLRFNTDENIYLRGSLSDAVYKAAGARKREKVSQVGQKIEAPPMSMTDRKSSDRKSTSGLFYTPKLNEAPQLDVPMDLPDLPGIADDITFNLSENERIAPSLYIDNLPDLPEPEVISQNASTTDSKASDTTDVKNTAKPPAPALPPPPPPPPPAEIKQQIQSVAPPPPPPPPATLSSQPKPNVATPATGAPVELADARMNLMEAIRKAGGVQGAKLRTAAAAEVAKSAQSDTKSGETKPPSGDLMADLHNKLLMRRKGISGAKEQEPGSSGTAGGGNVLNRLSALIPPPPPKAQPANNSATDASDENDEWTD